jgi:hypothetical protein
VGDAIALKVSHSLLSSTGGEYGGCFYRAQNREEKVSGTNGTGISGGNQDVVDLVGETRNP